MSFSHQCLEPLKRELDKTDAKQMIQQLYAKHSYSFRVKSLFTSSYLFSRQYIVLFCILIHKVLLGQSNPCLHKCFMKNIALTHESTNEVESTSQGN